MIRGLLVIWSMLASAALLVFGLYLELSKYGDRGAGVVVLLMASGLGLASVMQGSIEWNWRRRRRVDLRPLAPEPPPRTTTPKPRKPQRRRIGNAAKASGSDHRSDVSAVRAM